MSDMTFKRNQHGTNYLLQCDGFYLSYNPHPGLMGIAMFGADEGGDETALCIEGATKDGRTRFLILNGDFREEYEKAAPQGLDACKAVYEKHAAEHSSSWTTSADA